MKEKYQIGMIKLFMTPYFRRDRVQIIFYLQYFQNTIIVMILSFRTGRSGQTVQTQTQLLEEQSDQGLHCLHFHLHLLNALLPVYGKDALFKF